jgi:hypothetical protein
MEPNFANNKELDALTFKDIFRYAHKHSLLDENAVLNWFEYRDSRNQTAHNYGEILAEITLGLVPKFIIDSKNLVLQIEKANVIKK